MHGDIIDEVKARANTEQASAAWLKKLARRCGWAQQGSDERSRAMRRSVDSGTLRGEM
jgi:hypothetical protein